MLEKVSHNNKKCNSNVTYENRDHNRTRPPEGPQTLHPPRGGLQHSSIWCSAAQGQRVSCRCQLCDIGQLQIVSGFPYLVT